MKFKYPPILLSILLIISLVSCKNQTIQSEESPIKEDEEIIIEEQEEEKSEVTETTPAVKITDVSWSSSKEMETIKITHNKFPT